MSGPAEPVTRDPVIDGLVGRLRYCRSRPDEHLELESRVGQFDSSLSFQAGFHDDHRNIIESLQSALKQNTEKHQDRWQTQPGGMLMHMFYHNNLRRTLLFSTSPPQNVYIVKHKLGELNIHTDRPYHLRFSLKGETPADMTPGHSNGFHTAVERQAPQSVQIGSRHSFIECVTSPVHGWQVRFRYDLTKLTPPGRNKMEAMKHQCRWHCEIELVSPLAPLSDKGEERLQDQWIAKLWLARSCVLLGTHYVNSEGAQCALPTPKLKVIH